jgi:hypothetical protein
VRIKMEVAAAIDVSDKVAIQLNRFRVDFDL